MTVSTSIPGARDGDASLVRSPVSVEEFRRMQATATFGEADVAALRRSYEILKDQTEAILDVWYGFVASQPHLLAAFAGSDGRPDAAYLAAVRRRFGQWILDTARAEYDSRWLDDQHEIGLRHHRTKKNRTDGVAAAPIVRFRDLFPLIFPVTHTLRPFLAAKNDPPQAVEAMAQAWLKSCLLQLALWSYPYVKEGDY